MSSERKYAGDARAWEGRARAMREHATRQQHKAADPAWSVFVNANAGSGKTYLLVNRVIRLLLDGARPEKILCLTYTRAAAAQMRERLFARLAEWISCPDEELLRRIRAEDGLNHAHFPHELLPRARRLFARALETPGGLKVMTIHAFCERLLQAFPVEAGMPPGFEILDEADVRAMLDEARRKLLRGEGEAARDVREQLALLATLSSEGGLQKLLARLMDFRHLLVRMADNPQLRAEVLDALARWLGLRDGAPREAERWRGLMLEGFDHREVAAARDLLARLVDGGEPKTTDRDTLAFLQRLVACLRAGDGEGAWECLCDRMLTRDGAPRKQLLTKSVREAAPELEDWLRARQNDVHDHHQGALAARLLAANAALLEVGCAIARLYEEEKLRAGRFDYDDLILRTLELLESVEGQWVLYRLDGGIDHILLDEAQDTSPEQWRILELLSEELMAGQGAEHAVERTVFAVGDVKQSIYSFQGAAPEAFERMRELFDRRLKAAGRNFREVPLSVSFRTVQPILDVVEKVLDQPDFRLGGEEKRVEHRSARATAEGFVELWPPEEGAGGNEDEEERDIWSPPEELAVDIRPQLRLAARIADAIRRWLNEGAALPPDPPGGEARPLRPRDILILVRNRTTLMEAIVSALKQRGIPVAGVDRLKVSDHIAVQDMLALGRFLILPTDDLSLAAALKSPLLERDDGRPFTDDDLLRLRAGVVDFEAPPSEIRAIDEERSLWAQLNAAAEAGAPVRRAVERLERWRDLAGVVAPYELFAAVLWRDGGMRRFLARLGHEAVEPLEALLDLAMRHEREAHPSLVSFIEWIAAEAPEIKREVQADAAEDEDGPGEVRVMTVHGAKGLESPVVFLADTFSVPDERHLNIIEVAHPDDPHGEKLPLWVGNKARRPLAAQELLTSVRAAAEEEYNRLLYVAMTRAADRLYVCGAPSRRRKRKGDDGDDKERKKKKNGEEKRIRSWYERLREALEEMGAPVTLADGRVGRRYPAEAPMPRAESVPETAEAPAPPAWARRPARPEPGPALWLSPSRLSGAGLDEAAPMTAEAPVISPLSTARHGRDPLADPLRRGVLIHALLEHLPEVAPPRREALALAWLTAPGRNLTREQAEALWREVRAVLEEPRFAPLFGPGARAEVPFAATVHAADGRRLRVQGQIDRLVVSPREVIIADFKTARPVPESIEEVPEAYVRQLALYALAMRRLWPGRAVRCALLFTAAPAWVEIPSSTLREAIPEMT